ncbi:MAG: DMT family transporter, partial [Anaerolineae bacterium]|nr:DMT family transporter [Anaerolineae bacterium]
MTQDSQTSTGTLRGYLLVLLAASLWATLGVIYTVLARDSGLAAISVAALRAGMGGLLLLGGLFFLRRDWLRINRRALIVVVLYGIFGVALFYASYVNAILAVGVAVAAVLLYTAPAWVALIAWRFLGEQLTKRHVAALLLTLIGAALVAQVFAMGAVRLDVVGVLWGLLA